MSAKKYIVAVVGIIKKNGQMANAGDEVTADQFNNFEEHVLKGGYVKERAEYIEEQKQSDEDQKKAAEAKEREDLIVAYKKAFKVDAPADAATLEIKNAIADEKAISSDGKKSPEEIKADEEAAAKKKVADDETALKSKSEAALKKLI